MLKNSELLAAYPETSEFLKKNKPVVIKIGGSTLEERNKTLYIIAELYRQGFNLIIVHGGGKDIDQALMTQDIQPKKVNGKRVTDGVTLAIAREELTKINGQLVADLNNQYKVPAIGFIAAGVLTQQDETLGFVGKNPVVRKSLFQASIGIGQVPVVAPITAHINNVCQDLNTNADEVASAIAREFQSLLIMVTDVPGVMRNGEIMQQFHPEDMDTVTGGMIPKVKACLDVANTGGEAVICQLDDILENVLGTRQQGTYFGKN